jgi:hypothetical protein
MQTRDYQRNPFQVRLKSLIILLLPYSDRSCRASLTNFPAALHYNGSYQKEPIHGEQTRLSQHIVFSYLV